MQKDIIENITIQKQAGSLVLFTGEIPFEELEKYRAVAVAEIAKDIAVDGFRKGHVPENIIIQRVGEMPILTEMAERTISHLYPELVKYHNLDVIGYPQISITKLAKNNPFGFTITIAVVPPITLPDYTKIAQDINKAKESKEVTDAEVDKQIEEILRQKSAYERLQQKTRKDADKTQINAETHVHGENCDHNHDAEVEKPIEDIKDLVLPELTDEFVKTLGKAGQFESVDDFKKKIREHLAAEKARDVDSRHRAKITDAVIEKSEMELPQVLIDAEINQMLGQMEEDLKRAQLTLVNYLEHIKKTKEELTKEWIPAAEKRAKLQLVLNEIAKKETITPDPAQLDAEVDQILNHYKDADEKRVRVYVTSVLTNEEVLKKLEAM